MSYPRTKLLTPIAAALALALATGGAAAASPQNNSDNMNQQSSDSTNQQSWNNMDQQSADNMNQQSWNNMDQQSRDAYREGQIWTTYVLNPALQSYRINSDVQGDKVTLSGTVDNKYDKWLAGHIAQEAKGVTTVANGIKVDPTIVVTTFVPANAYARHVRNATTSVAINAQLLRNEYTDGLDVNVKARNGKVTLTGVADTQKAKRRAGAIAANTKGVTSVDNRLTVSGESVASSMDMVDDHWISEGVRASYMFTAGMDSGDIDVDVNNGTVTLAGTVDSNFERARAISIAQHILGVDAVKAGGLRVAPDRVATTN